MGRGRSRILFVSLLGSKVAVSILHFSRLDFVNLIDLLEECDHTSMSFGGFPLILH